MPQPGALVGDLFASVWTYPVRYMLTHGDGLDTEGDVTSVEDGCTGLGEGEDDLDEGEIDGDGFGEDEADFEDDEDLGGTGVEDWKSN